jgi:hypothetical protein
MPGLYPNVIERRASSSKSIPQVRSTPFGSVPSHFEPTSLFCISTVKWILQDWLLKRRPSDGFHPVAMFSGVLCFNSEDFSSFELTCLHISRLEIEQTLGGEALGRLI